MSEAIDNLIDAIAEQLAEKAGRKLIVFLQSQCSVKADDPLLAPKAIAKHLQLGERTVRRLIETGDLHRAPGLIEIRVRQSVVDAYGKPSKK